MQISQGQGIILHSNHHTAYKNSKIIQFYFILHLVLFFISQEFKGQINSGWSFAITICRRWANCKTLIPRWNLRRVKRDFVKYQLAQLVTLISQISLFRIWEAKIRSKVLNNYTFYFLCMYLHFYINFCLCQNQQPQIINYPMKEAILSFLYQHILKNKGLIFWVMW